MNEVHRNSHAINQEWRYATLFGHIHEEGHANIMIIMSYSVNLHVNITLSYSLNPKYVHRVSVLFNVPASTVIMKEAVFSHQLKSVEKNGQLQVTRCKLHHTVPGGV